MRYWNFMKNLNFWNFQTICSFNSCGIVRQKRQSTIVYVIFQFDVPHLNCHFTQALPSWWHCVVQFECDTLSHTSSVYCQTSIHKKTLFEAKLYLSQQVIDNISALVPSRTASAFDLAGLKIGVLSGKQHTTFCTHFKTVLKVALWPVERSGTTACCRQCIVMIDYVLRWRCWLVKCTWQIAMDRAHGLVECRTCS